MPRAMIVLRRLLRSQQAGLLLIIAALMVALALAAGSHVDESTGATVNNFFNSYTLIQTATDASFIAIMAVGATVVIISAGIDLSVGSVYALAGVVMGLALRGQRGRRRAPSGWACSSASRIGLAAGAVNGAMVVGLRRPPVHHHARQHVDPARHRLRHQQGREHHAARVADPLRQGAARPGGGALPGADAGDAGGRGRSGALYLERTVMGRHVFALGGNAEASRYSGLRLGRIQIGVYVLAGGTAGLAAFLGASFYGSVSCGDATGYELYVIASAVVGGARLSGGRGSAINAMLGAVLIVLIRQSIRTLHLDQNYEWIIIGCAIVVAVVLDQASARFAARRLAEGGRRER